MRDASAVVIREAVEEDAAGVCDVFRAAYGKAYSYPEFYETGFVKRLILGDDALMFVALDRNSGKTLGTASVLLEIGAMSDLTGEFGRLAVIPDARGCRIGSMLMDARLAAVRERLHVGIVDARITHPYSLRIAQRHRFTVAGFAPLRHFFKYRESTCVLAQWFNDALDLRRNNPRIVHEALPIATLSLENASLPVDVIIDDDAQAYPRDSNFAIEELSTTGYSTLLRIERGRIRNREVFGPMRLHYGFFKLHRSHAQYLIARDGKHVAGAIGFIHDEHDRSVRIFELITPNDRAVYFLFHQLLSRCEEEWDIDVVEVDVRATSPRLQRTLLELGFVPSAYVPAMVFHDVERFDVIRMTRLLVAPDLGHMELTPEAEEMKDLVMAPLIVRQAAPIVQRALARLGLLRAMTPEQGQLLASACTQRRFPAGQEIFRRDEKAAELLLILEGRIDVRVSDNGEAVGEVLPGETLGELGLLERGVHSASAVARTDVEALAIEHSELDDLMRRRPDIGLAIYRYLSDGLARKLRRADER